MIRKVGKAACPNYRLGCCGFLKMLVRKITEINSPLSRRGAGGEAYEQDYVYSSGIDYYADGKG
jgi:hypothetical protein